VLLTIGRMPKALDLARAFRGAGWRVVVADPHAWHPARLSRAVARCHRVRAPADGAADYLADMASVAAQENAELVVTVSEETLHAVALEQPGCRVFAMPAARVREVYDKLRFIAVARGAGLAVPETALLAGGQATRDVVIKPRFGSAGRGLRFVAAGEALPPASKEPMLVQQRIDGQVLSTCGIAREGRMVANVVYRGEVFSGSVAVAFARVPQHPAIEAWCARFAAATGWTGFLSFDFIVDAAGTAWAIECNPRVTSGVHFMHPEDLARAVLDPTFAGPARLREHALMQQLWTTLTECWAAIADPPERRRRLRALATARDVTWQARDPLPLLLMPFASWRIMWLAASRRISFGEAATLDIAWKPGGDAPAP
jgi:predicted ATP-grasp superfamily ATP-dependent carboligase